MIPVESIRRIVEAEVRELEARHAFDGVCDPEEWAIDRYRELCDEASADEVDDFFENEWRWSIIEDEAESAHSDLLAMVREYQDSYAANELGDELWENGIDPWDDEIELLAEDMQRDADIEAIMMCRAAEAEEAYFKKQEEEAKIAKRNREEVQKKWTF